MKRVVCFGEIMLRLSPPGHERFLQSPNLVATFGGGEANVAVSLARLGVPATFVSKLPDNAIGDACLGELARHGVDTSRILRGGPRLGVYWCEKGASQRSSKVIYDRAGSSVALAAPSEYDWPSILSGATWFHLTGITPALSPEAATASLEACRTARELGLRVSCDLNYRKNLWDTKTAGTVMAGLMPYVDTLVANEEDAEKVFGIRAPGGDVASGGLPREGYVAVAAELAARFGFGEVAITLRESRSASENGWAGMLRKGGVAHFSRGYDVTVVDRVGGGDSFAAGLIRAELAGLGPAEAIEFAVAASCLKHSIEGDFNLTGLAEIEALARGDGSGRVQR